MLIHAIAVVPLPINGSRTISLISVCININLIGISIGNLAGCPEGGVVLDPFMGSGTTGMVAAMYQRNFIGFELNPEYCKMAEKRIEPYLMQQTIF